jgi:hypothetical protein
LVIAAYLLVRLIPQGFRVPCIWMFLNSLLGGSAAGGIDGRLDRFLA